MQGLGALVLAHCTVQGENRLVCIFGGLPISNAIVNNALACGHRNFSLKFAGLKVCKAKVVVLLSTYIFIVMFSLITEHIKNCPSKCTKLKLKKRKSVSKIIDSGLNS